MVLGGKVGACVKEQCFWLVLLAGGVCDIVLCHCSSDKYDSMVVRYRSAGACLGASLRF